MTTTTHFPENRKATFSLKKALAPVSNFFVSIYDATVEARRLQAAMELAQHLKTHNRDFRNWSIHEIMKHIQDEQNPVGLDKKPIKERE